jgi:PIN domain nuclease of toxin-antitoxin system
MRLILDTNVLIRALIEPNKLSPGARAVLEDPGHEVFFSVASVWEIAIKSALGKADFLVSPEELVESAQASGFVELPVRTPAALKAATLPHLHRDPFDRLLVAQAMTEPAQLYTTDKELLAYSELVVHV